MTFGAHAYGLTTGLGTSAPARTWLFAEGTTVHPFETFLTVLNPNMAAARVTADFSSQTGSSLGSKTFVVGAQRRATLHLNVFLHASGIATMVTSTRPVLVERAEYFGSPNAPRVAGSDALGHSGAAMRWSFPSGDTNNSEFLLLYNPSRVTVAVDAIFYAHDGKTLARRVYVLPHARCTMDVKRLIPRFAPAHGEVLQVVSGRDVVAEHTVFGSYHTSLWCSAGPAG